MVSPNLGDAIKLGPAMRMLQPHKPAGLSDRAHESSQIIAATNLIYVDTNRKTNSILIARQIRNW